MDEYTPCLKSDFYILSGSFCRRRKIHIACQTFLDQMHRTGRVTCRHNLKVAEKNFYSDTKTCKHTAIIDLLLSKDDQRSAANMTPANVSLLSFSAFYFIRRVRQVLPRCHFILLGPDYIDYFGYLLRTEIGPDFMLLPHRDLYIESITFRLNLFETEAWSQEILSDV